MSHDGGELRDQAESSLPPGESRSRRASDQTPLGRIVAPIDRAFDAGDYALTAELLERNPLAAWYGIPLSRFSEITAALIREGLIVGGFMKVMSILVAPHEAVAEAPIRLDEMFVSPRSLEGFSTLSGEMFKLRLQGRPVDAMSLARELKDTAGFVLQPLFDTQQSLGQFSAVQLGITAMLAGGFEEALTAFTQARMHVRVPELAFLARDASVKAAIVHALYGDPEDARLLLDKAEQMPRTESWAESSIDAHAEIASAALLVEDPKRSLRILTSIPMDKIGEMWPFFAEARHRSLLYSNKINEARRQQAMFEQLPLPRVEGQGYSGSVFQIHSAQRAILSGNIVSAREHIERADGSIAATAILKATVELVAGRPREALELATELREATDGLRYLNMLRLSVVTSALFALGAKEDCRATINSILKTTDDFTAWDASSFPLEVREFAEAEFEEWPRVEPGRERELYNIPSHTETLTIREQELLRALVGGDTREEIAKTQFISLNTLKAHLRSVYRKLKVSSRTAAIIEAERRGII